MAVTAAMQGRAGRFGSIVVTVDRDKAFRAARRHSATVRALRKLLPLAAIVCLAFYVLPAKLSYDADGQKATIDKVKVTADDLRMEKPRLKGTHPVQGEYDVRAEYGLQNLTERDKIRFETITGDLISSNGDKTVLTAPGGIYSSKAEFMEFDRGVNIVRDSGLSVILKAAIAYFHDKRVMSTQGPVEVRLHESHIRAESMELFANESRVVFTGNVSVHLERLPTSEQDGGGQGSPSGQDHWRPR